MDSGTIIGRSETVLCSSWGATSVVILMGVATEGFVVSRELLVSSLRLSSSILVSLESSIACFKSSSSFVAREFSIAILRSSSSILVRLESSIARLISSSSFLAKELESAC